MLKILFIGVCVSITCGFHNLFLYLDYSVLSASTGIKLRAFLAGQTEEMIAVTITITVIIIKNSGVITG